MVESAPRIESEKIVLATNHVSLFYAETRALSGVTIKIPEKKITAVIGPSGCGKSSLLRSFNRMNEFIPDFRLEGEVLYHGRNIYDAGVDPVEIRRSIGMVFQKPNPFPKSIFQNVAWGPTINGFFAGKRKYLHQRELVEKSLRRAGLWEEVKDRLDRSGMELSGGQQQRLCIARALAMDPEVILMDEPCSALDPASTARIEDLLFELRENYTIVIVTHNMQQAARISDYTAFFDSGKLVEFGGTNQIFTRPSEKRTEDYVTGRFG